MRTEAHYLHELGKELVLLTTRSHSEPPAPGDAFENGRRFALYEIMSLMQKQAKAFGPSDNQIGFEGVDIESFLK